MEEKRKRGRRFLVIGIAVALAVVWIVRVITINQYYEKHIPKAREETYEMGEKIICPNDIFTAKENGEVFYLTVHSMNIVEYDDYLTENGYQELSDRQGGERKIILVNATLSIDEGGFDYINLQNFTCQTTDAVFYQDNSLMKQINPVLQGNSFTVQLQDCTSVELLLPFVVEKDRMGMDWYQLDRISLYFTLTTDSAIQYVRLSQ